MNGVADVIGDWVVQRNVFGFADRADGREYQARKPSAKSSAVLKNDDGRICG
jgi:hypothetical protein